MQFQCKITTNIDKDKFQRWKSKYKNTDPDTRHKISKENKACLQYWGHKEAHNIHSALSLISVLWLWLDPSVLHCGNAGQA